jgi:signal transduction histidine kinase
VNAWADAIHQEDAGRSIDAYTAAFARRVPFELEYRLQRRDGVYRWIFDQGVPRFHVDGAFAGYIGSGFDVTERKLAEEALSLMSGRLLEAQEEERTRLARELHDDITPRLTLVSMCLDRLKYGGARAAEFGEEIEAASRQIGELVQDMQALSHRLHSPKLELLGLARAAAGLCAELSDRHGVTVDFRAEDVAERMPPELSLCLFRVLQEALNNAIKHSGSRQIHVSLRNGARAIELLVVDAGAGFDRRATSARGLGLTSMTERLKLVDGELSIDSKPGGGTTVRARVPRRG